MKRRYLLAAGIGAAGIGVVLGLAAVPESSVTKARYQLVERGMTAGQVEAVFGMPPTHVTGVPRLAPGPQWHVIREWRAGDGSSADIFFEEPAGTVYHKQWHDSTETIGEKLRRWVRWPWW